MQGLVSRMKQHYHSCVAQIGCKFTSASHETRDCLSMNPANTNVNYINFVQCLFYPNDCTHIIVCKESPNVVGELKR